MMKEEGEDATPTAQATLSKSSTFAVVVVGQIESVSFSSHNHVYCKYSCAYGADWRVVAGCEEGVTQIGRRAVFEPSAPHSKGTIVVWNHPIDVTFCSSNVYGWPQMVFSVFGLNAYGGDVIRGYGATHVPPIPGAHVLTVPLFVPEASSLLGRVRAWITGSQPEFVHAKVAAQGEGRGVLTVQSGGFLVVKVNVISRDFKKQGFKCSA